jgi:D-alanine-D-alanine ligase
VKRLRVGVIYGGRSGEHEVSLASAAAVFANLDRAKYEPVPILIDKEGRWVVAERPPLAMKAADTIEQARLESGRQLRDAREVHLIARPSADTMLAIDRKGSDTEADGSQALVTGVGLDVIFPVLHGPFGEDGTVQGLLELLDVPYVGAGVLASSLCMDKVVFKEVLAAADVPQVPSAAVREHRWRSEPDAVRNELSVLGTPVFVKPARLGSSVGISKVWAEADMGPALDDAFVHDSLVIVEGFSDGLEVECSVMGLDEPEASVPGEIVVLKGEWYDFTAKYDHGGMELVVPARLPESVREEVRRLAVDTFKRVGCAGLARVDFFVEGERVLVNELNTMPGFTETSVFPKLWDAGGLAAPALCDRLLGYALERYDAERSGHVF